MANVPNPPNSATAAPAGVPESPQAPTTALPFALSETMTAAQAEQRLVELRTDEAWRARWIVGDAPANTEFDALTRKAVGQQPPAPIAPRDENDEALRALGPPAKPEDYRLDNVRGSDGGFVQMDQATRTLATNELFPAAHTLDLSQSDIAMVASNVANPTTYEQCESVLHKLWPGEEFERGLADFRTALANQPKARAVIEQYIELSNSPMLISAVVAAFRRRQLRG